METTIIKGKPSPDFTGRRFGSLTIRCQYIGKDGRTCVDYVCDCGNEKEGAHLANVKFQKNCKKCQPRGVTRRPYGESSFRSLYNQYVQNARLRGYAFDLSLDDFRTLTQQFCFYCGSLPAAVIHPKRSYGEYIYNGVDRKDNTKGYTLDNSVPCCKFCNLTKNTTDFKMFIGWIRSVYENTKEISLE